jgi:hypothetical protein
VHGAAKTLVQNGAIDFAKLRGGGRILHADDDAVGMEKVPDGGTFTKKF